MITPSNIFSLAATAVVSGAAALLVIPPKVLPLVEITSVSYDYVSDLVTYERIVHSADRLRGDWTVVLVNVDTEKALTECSAKGEADYGPDESERQVFTADDFSGAGCRDAMIKGATYEWVVTVIPPVGEPSQRRSDPFIPIEY